MPSLVIDASFAVALVLPDEAKPSGSMVALLKTGGAIVPGLWPFEVGNTLVMAQRRRRIAPTAIERVVAEVGTLPVEVDTQSSLRSWRSSVNLAVRHRLTVYDAAYLELAARLHLPLATLDGELRKAARKEGVSV